MWWPASLRRPTDLWRRLPWPPRLVRVALSAFIALLPAVILLRQGLENTGAATAAHYTRLLMLSQWALTAAAAASLVFALMWASHRGLAWRESLRLLLGSTMPSEGWREEHVVHLLAPVRRDARNPNRDSPAELRRAIDSLVVELAEGDAPLVARVRGSASVLVHAIAALDTEVASLMCTASVGDVDRLAAQLAELTVEGGRRSSEQHEMASLVRDQLALVRRIRDRCELVSRRRAAALNRLRGLWSTVSRLHREGGGSLAPDAHLHGLLDEIDREVELTGLGEV